MSQYTIDEILAQLEAWYAEQRQKDPVGDDAYCNTF
jgi:hypothetical protein